MTSGLFVVFLRQKIKYEMAKKYSPKYIENQEVNDPRIQYLVSEQRALRTITDEELERSMTLEELDNHLTELIRQHYHAK